VKETIGAGARLVVGGAFVAGRGYTYAPTVLTGVPEGSPALVEEVFGPVAPIVVVRDADDAVRRANASRFGLGGNLWTRDVERAKRIARDLASGSVFINGMTASDPALPFGGIKKSGYGRELARYGLRELVNVKTVWVGPMKGDSPRGAGVE
jgi:succinate-semialdehyde dehydrogenase/glutarate-semialdehyde dehydrogenase